MMHRLPFLAKKGMIRLLILEALSKGPAHGYEVIKRIESRFMGIYTPSPGIIYPNLQHMEEEGLLKSEEEDGRKVYTVTEKGLNYLEEKRRALSSFMESKMRHFPKHKAEIMLVGRDIIKDVTLSIKDMSDEQASQIIEILKRTRDEVRRVLSGGA